jgi:hypothetical protein
MLSEYDRYGICNVTLRYEGRKTDNIDRCFRREGRGREAKLYLKITSNQTDPIKPKCLVLCIGLDNLITAEIETETGARVKVVIELAYTTDE